MRCAFPVVSFFCSLLQNVVKDVGAPPPNPGPTYPNVTPEYSTLIVMIAVLAIILLFCFWGAPGVRDYCRRSICCCHCRTNTETQREESGTPADDRSATPTIILLPFGRMLVVDRNVLTQLQADPTGIDFMELSANLIRAHHVQCGSTPSILDSNSTSKGLSPISLGFSPPSYEDIFGEKNSDLPPSYSELSLLFRQRQNDLAEVDSVNELQCFHIGNSKSAVVSSEGDGAVRSESDKQISEPVCIKTINESDDGHQRKSWDHVSYESEGRLNETETCVPSISRTSPTEDKLPVPNKSVPSNGVHGDGGVGVSVRKLSAPVDAHCRYCIVSFENEKSEKSRWFTSDYIKRPSALSYIDYNVHSISKECSGSHCEKGDEELEPQGSNSASSIKEEEEEACYSTTVPKRANQVPVDTHICSHAGKNEEATACTGASENVETTAQNNLNKTQDNATYQNARSLEEEKDHTPNSPRAEKTKKYCASDSKKPKKQRSVDIKESRL